MVKQTYFIRQICINGLGPRSNSVTIRRLNCIVTIVLNRIYRNIILYMAVEDGSPTLTYSMTGKMNRVTRVWNFKIS